MHGSGRGWATWQTAKLGGDQRLSKRPRASARPRPTQGNQSLAGAPHKSRTHAIKIGSRVWLRCIFAQRPLPHRATGTECSFAAVLRPAPLRVAGRTVKITVLSALRARDGIHGDAYYESGYQYQGDRRSSLVPGAARASGSYTSFGGSGRGRDPAMRARIGFRRFFWGASSPRARGSLGAGLGNEGRRGSLQQPRLPD
jgi:hypothetical protein